MPEHDAARDMPLRVELRQGSGLRRLTDRAAERAVLLEPGMNGGEAARIAARHAVRQNTDRIPCRALRCLQFRKWCGRCAPRLRAGETQTRHEHDVDEATQVELRKGTGPGMIRAHPYGVNGCADADA